MADNELLGLAPASGRTGSPLPVRPPIQWAARPRGDRCRGRRSARHRFSGI